jgi:hypothetical protein
MKTLNIFAAMLLCIFLTAGAVLAAEGSTLNVMLTSQSPYPVEPGQIVDIEVALENTGLGDASNVVLEIVPASPFTLLPGQEQMKSFTKVSAMSSVKTSYKLYVDPSAISDTYDLNFKIYKDNNMNSFINGKIQITIQGEPKLVIDKVLTEPSEIEPGQMVTVKARIKNVGAGAAHYIQFTFVPNTTLITPVLSGGSFYMDRINPGEILEAEFMLDIDNSAEYKTYTAVLYAGYKDDSGTEGTNAFTVGIPVRGKPVLDILSTKLEEPDFTVNLQNIGTSTAKAIKVVLVQNGQIKDVNIVSELKPTKYKTLRFSGFSYGTAAVNITYLDEMNTEHTTQVPVSITKQTTEQKSEFPMTSIILLAVVVVETYYIFQLRKGRKHAK